MASAPSKVSSGNFLGTPWIVTASYLRTCACQKPGGSSFTLVAVDGMEADPEDVDAGAALGASFSLAFFQACRKRARTIGIGGRDLEHLAVRQLEGRGERLDHGLIELLQVLSQFCVDLDREY